MIRTGVWPEVERQADQLIHADLAWERERSGPFHGHDVITEHKAQQWRRRTVLTPAPDRAVLRGVYGRAYNTRQPWLNSRDGHVRASRSREPS